MPLAAPRRIREPMRAPRPKSGHGPRRTQCLLVATSETSRIVGPAVVGAVDPEYRVLMNAGHAPPAVTGAIRRPAFLESRSPRVASLAPAKRGTRGARVGPSCGPAPWSVMEARPRPPAPVCLAARAKQGASVHRSRSPRRSEGGSRLASAVWARRVSSKCRGALDRPRAMSFLLCDSLRVYD